MSIYKRAGSETYSYDFVVRGTRFSGSTGKSTQREAKLVEDAERAKARAEAKKNVAQRIGPMTIDVACGRFWLEIGQHYRRSDEVEWSLAYLTKHLGPNKLVRDISDSDVAELVARRRSDRVMNYLVEKGRAKRRKEGKERPQAAGTGKRVSPARVNRSVTETLRRIINRARDLWGQEVQPIRWRLHMLTEPEERVRELTKDEEVRAFAQLPEYYHPPIRYALVQGERLTACAMLAPDAIDWTEKTVSRKVKGGRTLVTPLKTEIFEMLKTCRGQHPDRLFVRDSGEPATPTALATAWRMALRRAGIKNFRFHDLRHTAGTRMLRQTGNLKMTQKLLGHRDIQSTMRYAHVLDQDLRDALDALSDAESPTKNPTAADKPLKRRARA